MSNLARLRILDGRATGVTGTGRYFDDEDLWAMPSDVYVLVSTDWVRREECRQCGGSGRLLRSICRRCGGDGEVEGVHYDPNGSEG